MTVGSKETLRQSLEDSAATQMSQVTPWAQEVRSRGMSESSNPSL